MKLVVDPKKCPQDHHCPAIAVCPVKAITQKDIYALPQINEDACMLCGNCIDHCPKKAFKLVS